MDSGPVNPVGGALQGYRHVGLGLWLAPRIKQ